MPEYIEAICRGTEQLNSLEFLPVLVVSPLPERHGNDIELVDWSPVGHQILLLQGWWEWGSDVAGNLIRVYDADTHKLSRESFVDDHFSKHFGRSCAVVSERLDSLRRKGSTQSRAVVRFWRGRASSRLLCREARTIDSTH
jgi:hypothetical protein